MPCYGIVNLMNLRSSVKCLVVRLGFMPAGGEA